MKIVVTTVIDLDRDSWSLNYGDDESAAEIRTSVKDYTRELLEQDFANRGLTATVVVR